MIVVIGRIESGVASVIVPDRALVLHASAKSCRSKRYISKFKIEKEK